MILKFVFAFVMILGTSGYTPSSKDYLLGLVKKFPLFNKFNFFDGPSKISNAPTVSSSITPTLEQMMYYNYYSASMYCPYELANLTCSTCKKFKDDVTEHTVLTNDDFDTLAVIAVSNKRKEIVIAYRGTMNIANIILDAILINGNNPTGPHCIKMHRGLYIATMSLYTAVVQAVGHQMSLHPDFKIVITGHSLGAGMARITQYFFTILKQFPSATLEVYTYGEPRVGNKHFADFINKQEIVTARAVARADLIPHIPPTSILGTKLIGDYYVQPQTEFWIDGKDGQRFCNRSQYEDPNCSRPIYNLQDHNKYFDTDIATCSIRQPVPWLTLPFVFQPVGLVPPLPEFVSNFLEGAATFIGIG